MVDRWVLSLREPRLTHPQASNQHGYLPIDAWKPLQFGDDWNVFVVMFLHQRNWPENEVASPPILCCSILHIPKDDVNTQLPKWPCYGGWMVFSVALTPSQLFICNQITINTKPTWMSTHKCMITLAIWRWVECICHISSPIEPNWKWSWSSSNIWSFNATCI